MNTTIKLSSIDYAVNDDAIEEVVNYLFDNRPISFDTAYRLIDWINSLTMGETVDLKTLREIANAISNENSDQTYLNNLGDKVSKVFYGYKPIKLAFRTVD